MQSFGGSTELPPLPDYQLIPQPNLIHPIPDKLLTLILPVVAYWAVSLFFHWIDVNDYFSKYRLHTPAEVLKRNHVSRWEVVRDVIIQQIIQTAVGILLNMTEPDEFIGKEEYDIAVWAQRIRIAQRAVPAALALASINAQGLSQNLAKAHPMLSGVVAGGSYPSLSSRVIWSTGVEETVPAFASWEILLAKAIYHVIFPALQYSLAIVVVDTWQYFLHRAMHMNKWLYTTFHARHHRLYVPYAYGALYNHPFEGFLLDTLGASIAYKIAGFNTRQGLCFFTGSTIKTVDDHCGYSLPWDPLQHITSNNAGYHDIHHQSWGIKTNFSQPFFTFWDRLLGTVWTGGDVSARYERDALKAQKQVNADGNKSSITNTSSEATLTSPPEPYQNEMKDAKLLKEIPASKIQPQVPSGKAELQAAGSREQVLEDQQYGGKSVLLEEAEEEKEAQKAVRRSNRRRTASSLAQSDSLRGLRERVTAHGRTGGILGMEHSH